MGIFNEGPEINDERADEIIKNGNLTTVADKVKELPVYGMFMKAVEEGKTSEDTERILTMMTLLTSFTDKELGLLITAVSNKMLFNALNIRLRSELGALSD